MPIASPDASPDRRSSFPTAHGMSCTHVCMHVCTLHAPVPNCPGRNLFGHSELWSDVVLALKQCWLEGSRVRRTQHALAPATMASCGATRKRRSLRGALPGAAALMLAEATDLSYALALADKPASMMALQLDKTLQSKAFVWPLCGWSVYQWTQDSPFW